MSQRHVQQLEELVRRQRKILVFAQSAWSEAQEENAKLRRVIAVLHARLERHGISIDVTLPTETDPEQQLKLPLEVP